MLRKDFGQIFWTTFYLLERILFIYGENWKNWRKVEKIGGN